jgi:hypothetical protein
MWATALATALSALLLLAGSASARVVAVTTPESPLGVLFFAIPASIPIAAAHYSAHLAPHISRPTRGW